MPNTKNTPSTDWQEQNLLMRCLARHVLREYPNKLKRKEFYDRWLNRHGQKSLDTLITLVNAEFHAIEGWCALFSRSVSYPAILDYLNDTKHSLAYVQESVSPTVCSPQEKPNAERAFYSPSAVTSPPWWSELPHLAPSNGGHYA